MRLSRSGAEEIENLGAWLTTVVGRVSLNALRSREVRQEVPVADRMLAPIVDPAAGMDPEQEALLADSVGLALLIVLETLSPPERLVFVLHDIFSVPFDEIGTSSSARPRRRASSRAGRGAGSAATPWSPTAT